MPPKIKNPDKHFWSMVKVSGAGECWEWQHSKNNKGYGNVQWNGRVDKAHRVAWTLTHGDPGSLFVLHSCDNRSCCNPSHLFLGTNQDNMDDMVKKGRASRLAGENNPRAKLKPSQVLEIKHRYALGNVTQTQLAKEYGVSQAQIGYIVRNEEWKEF
jgi:hypothetical protein